jgi:ketosteroid isomerase-like protein
MKSLSLLLATIACVAAPAVSAHDAAVEAPIQRMMDGFNKGDIAAVRALHVASPTIVDNVAPFAWSGPGAFDRWLADLAKGEAAAGKTNGVVTFAPVVDEVVSGDRAYVVTRSSYAYKQNGRAMRETGYTSFVLVKVGSEWKVDSWSWASPAAVPGK